VGDALHVAKTHAEKRLGAIERLGLRLLVNAEHNCIIGRIKVFADDVADLLNKERVRRDLE